MGLLYCYADESSDFINGLKKYKWYISGRNKYQVVLDETKKGISVDDAIFMNLIKIKDRISYVYIGADSLLTQKSISQLNLFPNLECLRIYLPIVSDNEIILLTTLGNLTQLDIQNASITYRSVEAISKMKNIEVLNLSRNKGIKDNDFKILSKSKITSLFINDSSITDEGIKNICEALPMLENIEIASTSVTDKGANYFLQMRKLDSLDIRHTKISKEMITKLSEKVRMLTTRDPVDQ